MVLLLQIVPASSPPWFSEGSEKIDISSSVQPHEFASKCVEKLPEAVPTKWIRRGANFNTFF